MTAGKAGWSTKIQDALPWFALGTGTGGAWVSGEVTLGDMYSHRSGLPDHGGDDLEGLGYDRQTILERLRYLPLTPFRASYAYTNYGIMAAAQAVSHRVGKDWALLARDALYAPLGMARTTSSYQEFLALPNRASGHSPIDDNLDGTWRVTPVHRNDYLGEAKVTVSGDALQLHMGPAGGGKNWSLTHWDGDTFKLLLGTDDASATAVSAVRFDLSGPTATLWLEYYDGTSKGRGTLSRADWPARRRRPA